jgi:SRSO17 transposase
MSPRQLDFSRHGERLQVYLDGLTEAAGHADRVVPIENYTKGLMLPIERKSVEPMAARLAPDNVRQMHQSLHHVVADAAWSDGLWMTRDSPRRVLIRLESPVSTAGSWASRTTAEWW